MHAANALKDRQIMTINFDDECTFAGCYIIANTPEEGPNSAESRLHSVTVGLCNSLAWVLLCNSNVETLVAAPEIACGRWLFNIPLRNEYDSREHLTAKVCSEGSR
jgi:hypothetical protein